MRTFMSPVVARIAAEHGLDLGQIPGTGRGGRVTKHDILAFIQSAARPQPTPAAPAAPAAAAAPPAAPAPPVAPTPPAPAPAPVAAAPVAPAPPAGSTAPAPAPAPAAGSLNAGDEIYKFVHHAPRHRQAHAESLDTTAQLTSAIEVDMSAVVAHASG